MKTIITILVAAMLLLSIGITPALAQTSACGSTYVVQPGDYLTKIANQCDVTYSALLAANPQITDPNLIYPNQVINIPNGSTGNNGGIPVTGGSVYVVQPGDNLSSIANRFGVSLNSLISANKWLTNPGQIYPGMAITLPQGAERVPTVTVTPTFGRIGTDVTLAATGFRANTSVVVGFGQVGKTYYQLDKPTTDANGALYKQYAVPNWPNVIQQDGQYSFTVTREDNTAIGAFSNPFTLTGTGNAGNGGIPVTGGGSYYVVKSGDTLSGIAAYYGTTVSALLAYNPAIGSSLLIYPGQRIYIPAYSNVTPSGPYVNVSPLLAHPGGTIQVRAGNFPANAIVDVRIAKQGDTFTGVVDDQANSQGVVTAQISVPASAETGEQWVVIVTTTERVNGTRVVSQPIAIQ